MSDFQEIITYLQSKGLTPEQDGNWINVNVNDTLELTFNGPFYWSDNDPNYGVSILPYDSDEASRSYSSGWQIGIVEWLDKNLIIEGSPS